MKSNHPYKTPLHPDRFAPGNYVSLAIALGAAGIIAGLASGCAFNKDSSASAPSPNIQSIGLVTKGADTAEAYYELGKYHFWQNRLVQAQAEFEHALKLRPDNVDVMNGLGAIHDRLGNYAAAQRLYQQAIAKDPYQAHLWANYGYSLILEGRFNDAVERLEQAVSLDASNFPAQRNLVIAREGAGKKLASTSDLAKQDPSTTPSPIKAAGFSVAPFSPAIPHNPGGVVVKEASASTQPSIVQSIVTPASARQASVQPVPSAAIIRPVVATAANKNMPANSVSVAGIAVAGQQDTVKPVVEAVSFVPDRENASGHSKQLHPVASREDATPSSYMESNLGQFRIEISNGNGVTGMARAMKATLSSQGANVTRVTNAKPFNMVRTTITCTVDQQKSADALAALLPVKPLIIIGSVAHRNVDVRIMLGADTALALNKANKKVNKTVLATLAQ